MKIITITSCAAITALITSCVNSPLAFRSVSYQTIQEATTDGKITNKPTAGGATINADKTLQDTLKANAETPTTPTTTTPPKPPEPPAEK